MIFPISNISDKRNNKLTSIYQQSFFIQVQLNDLPQNLKQKITTSIFSNQKVIKIQTYPHGFVIAFYIIFLNMYFTKKSTFERELSKLFDLLDDDDFKFIIPNDPNSLYLTDWSTSKIKRIISEYFRDITYGKYESVHKMLEENVNRNKLLFLFCMNILIYCERVQSFREDVDFETCRQVLFDYFDMKIYQNADSYLVPCANAQIESDDQNNLYLIFPEDKSDIYNFDMNSTSQVGFQFELQTHGQNNDVHDQIISKHGFNQNVYTSLQTKIYGKDFQISTNHSPKKNKSQTIQFFSEQVGVFQDIFKESQFIHRNSTLKDKFILSTQGTQWTSSSHNKKECQLGGLFQLKTCHLTTQKSLYDDPKEAEPSDVEYSFIDQPSPSASKKSLERKTTNFKASGYEQPKEEIKSLQQKWYQFCKFRRNKSIKIQQQNQLQNKVKKVVSKTNLKTTNQKPDFKKVKSRRRNTQGSNSQGSLPGDCVKQNYFQEAEQKAKIDTAETIHQFDFNKKLKQTTIHQAAKEASSLAKRQQQYIIQSPNKKNQAQGIFEKPSKFQINVTKQFTDSVILQQLNERNQVKIKMMKEKARQERQSLKFRTKERKTVN